VRVVYGGEPETKRFVFVCQGEHSMYYLTQADETDNLIRRLGGNMRINEKKQTSVLNGER
jgi:hypothetical protein